MSRNSLKINIGLSIFATIIILYVLFSGPPVGLSDNGDFGRIVYANGLEYTVHAEQRRFIYQNNFTIVENGETRLEKLFNALFYIDDFWNYPSIQNIFVKLSIGGNLLVNVLTGADIHIYRMEVLGLIYVFLYGLSMFTLFSSIRIKRQWLEITVKLLIVVMLCDVGYVLYFNSFYGEGLQQIFLVFSVAFGLKMFRDNPVKRDYILFVLSLLCYGWTKFANIPVTVMGLIFFLPCVLLLSKKHRRAAVLSTVVVLIGLVMIYFSIPNWMDFQTNYNSVFFGVLRDVDEAQAREFVKDLELPAYMEELRNTNYYIPSISETVRSDKFIEEFAKISKFDIALFYLKHPGQFLERLKISAQHSAMIRPAYLSNYGPQEPRLTFCTTFELWGGLRKQLPFDHWAFNLLILLTASGYLFWKGIKAFSVSRAKGLLFLGAAFAIAGSTFYNFCIPYIANGEGDIAKHLFAFVQNIDFLVMLIIYLMLEGLSRFIALFSGMSFKKRLTVILSPVLCMILAITGFSMLSAAQKDIMTGKYITLGEYGGKKLIWQIIDDKDGIYTLLAAEPVARGRFSDAVSQNAMLEKYGSSLWVDSRIRAYLNEEFVKSFSESERELMVSMNHKVLLSTGNQSKKETGVQEIFWSFVPELSDRDFDAAYAMNVEDMITLPNIRQIAHMARNGLNIKKTVPYWLDTPYYGNDSMLRIVEPDGYIYMKDAIVEDIGIVPCLYLRSGWGMKGEGTLKNPCTIVHP